MLDLPTRGESRIIKENGHEKAAAKNQKRESQNRSDSKATSKRSREASSRGDARGSRERVGVSLSTVEADGIGENPFYDVRLGACPTKKPPDAPCFKI